MKSVKQTEQDIQDQNRWYCMFVPVRDNLNQSQETQNVDSPSMKAMNSAVESASMGEAPASGQSAGAQGGEAGSPGSNGAGLGASSGTGGEGGNGAAGGIGGGM